MAKALDDDLRTVLQQSRLCGKAFGRGDELAEKRYFGIALRAAQRVQRKLNAKAPKKVRG